MQNPSKLHCHTNGFWFELFNLPLASPTSKKQPCLDFHKESHSFSIKRPGNNSVGTR